KKFGMLFASTPFVTSSLENQAQFSWDFQTRPKTQICLRNARRKNGKGIVAALRELGFDLTDTQAAEIVRGKDFIQLKNGPFDLDLIFAPDGIERFEDAWQRRIDVEGFPVCHIDDIIASKAATNRVKDRKS